MKEYLIIDGYNIINAWDELKNIAENDLEASRDKLVQMMLEYAALTEEEIIIVFDAYRVKKRSRTKQKYPKVTVVYTKENQTADSYIEKVIGELDKRALIRVATNDWAEQQIVLGKGCSRLSARELHIDIQNSRKKIKGSSRKKASKITLADAVDDDVLIELEKIRRNGKF